MYVRNVMLLFTWIFRRVICAHSRQFSFLSQDSLLYQAVKTHGRHIVLVIPGSDAISNPLH